MSRCQADPVREIRLKGVSVVLKWRPVVEVVTQEKRTSAVLPPSWQRALFGQQVNGEASCYAVVQLDPLVPNVAVTTRPELLFPPKSPLRCSPEHIAKLPVGCIYILNHAGQEKGARLQ